MLERALERGQEASDEEEDLLPVKLQLAVIAQLEGRIDEATEQYQSVLKDKPSDATLIAIAGNNLAVARGDADLFDSSKRLKAATSDAVFQKLPPQFAIRLLANHAILLLLMHKVEQCMEVLADLTQRDPASDIPARINAAIHLSNHKHSGAQGNRDSANAAFAECVSTLEKFKSTQPATNTNIDLSIAQINILHKRYDEALRVLDSLPSPAKFSSAVCAARVKLNVLLAKQDVATKVLDETVAYWDASMLDDKQSVLEDVLRASAEFKSRNGDHAAAAKDLEKILAMHPRDMSTVARLVLLYTKFDPAAIAKFEGQLPRMSDEDALDAYELEKLPVPRKVRWDKIAKDSDDVLVTSSKKKKTKKRKRMPKEYDPAAKPDPYRWLPLKDRPYYNKRRRKGTTKIGKGGAQGRVSEQDMAKLDQRALAEKEKAVKAEKEANKKTNPKNEAKALQQKQLMEADKEREDQMLRLESKKSSTVGAAAKLSARKKRAKK